MPANSHRSNLFLLIAVNIEVLGLKLNSPNATNIFFYAATVPNILMTWKLIIILPHTHLLADECLLNISERHGYLSETTCQILLFP